MTDNACHEVDQGSGAGLALNGCLQCCMQQAAQICAGEYLALLRAADLPLSWLLPTFTLVRLLALPQLEGREPAWTQNPDHAIRVILRSAVQSGRLCIYSCS